MKLAVKLSCHFSALSALLVNLFDYICEGSYHLPDPPPLSRSFLHTKVLDLQWCGQYLREGGKGGVRGPCCECLRPNNVYRTPRGLQCNGNMILFSLINGVVAIFTPGPLLALDSPGCGL